MIAAAAVFVTLSIITWILWNSFSRKCLPPGPTGLPVIGYLHKLGTGPVHMILAELQKKYGDIVSLYFGSKLVIVLNSRDAFYDAFVKKAKQFSARPRLPSSQVERGRVGVAHSGHTMTDLFRQNKIMNSRALQHLFSDKKNLDSLILHGAGKMVALFDKLTSENIPVDPVENFKGIVLNILISAMFRKDYTYDDPKFLQAVANSELFFEHSEAGNALDFFDFKLLRLLPNNTLNILQKSADEAHEFSVNLIQEYRSSNDKKPCLLHSYLNRFHRSLETEDITDDEINELSQVVADMIGAGFDTVASFLSWAMVYLIDYPEVKDRCRAEIKEVFGEAPLSIEQETSVPYYVATIYEMLRLSTPGSMGLPHCTTEDVQLRSYFIPKDAMVLANLWKINHDPQDWGNPDTLRPKRFLDEEGKVDTAAVKKLAAFSAGARRCPGEKLGFYVIFLLLGTIITSYDLKFVDAPIDMISRGGLTAKPKHYTISMTRC